jgi:hypothetical protein
MHSIARNTQDIDAHEQIRLVHITDIARNDPKDAVGALRRTAMCTNSTCIPLETSLPYMLYCCVYYSSLQQSPIEAVLH